MWKGFGAAVAVHIAVAVLLGILGYTFSQRPSQIIEVTLAGGNDKAAAAKGADDKQQVAAKQAAPKPQDDEIVEKKRQTPQEQTAQQEKPQETNETAQSNVDDGKADATGTGGGAGTGAGSGAGTGQGSGQGSGSGAGQGSGTGVPVTAPALLSGAEPKYPAAARNREIEGTVYVRMLVNTQGRVESVEVSRSSGNDALDRAATDAVNTWRFRPGRDAQGRAVRCYITVPVRFVLHDRRR